MKYDVQGNKVAFGSHGQILKLTKSDVNQRLVKGLVFKFT